MFRLYTVFLFVISIAISFWLSPIEWVLNTDYLILFGIFVTFTLSFHYIHTMNFNTGVQVTHMPNYGFVFIVLTNPLYHLIYNLLTEGVFIITDKNVPRKEKLWEFFYNFGLFQLLNSIGYYFFFQLAKEIHHFNLFFIGTLVICMAFISFFSKLSLIVALKLSDRMPDTFSFSTFFIQQTAQQVISTAPVFAFLIHFYSMKEYLLFATTIFIQIVMSRMLQQNTKELQREAELKAYKDIAHKDPLTNCYNRRFLKEKLKEIQKSKTSYAIVVADIDDFKRFNDSYNHDVGDQVIEHFVQSLQSQVQKGEYLVRSGGEEFILLLQDKNLSSVYERMEELRESLESKEFKIAFQQKTLPIKLTASFGISYYDGDSCSSIDDYLILADDKLYQSKRNGKNCVTC